MGLGLKFLRMRLCSSRLRCKCSYKERIEEIPLKIVVRFGFRINFDVFVGSKDFQQNLEF